MRAEFIKCRSWAEARRLMPDWTALMNRGRGGVWIFDGLAAYLEWHEKQLSASVAHLTGDKEDGSANIPQLDRSPLG